MRWKQWRVGVILPAAALVAGVMAALPGSAAASSAAASSSEGLCSTPAHGANCVDVSSAYPAVGYDGKYVGHDEPAALFYSDKAGSGNNNTYLLRLPKDPPAPPSQDGTGATDNFMLHPAFWFGMAMCDTQSFPNATTNCPADSDANIATSTDPASPKYIGNHSGTAFMEMQFYPPGWVSWPAGNSCTANQWCAALNIDSFSSNAAGVNNNSACLDTAGLEYVNFAFITHNGVAQAPADPTDFTAAATPNLADDMLMNSGDVLSVHLHDTAAGFRVDINDLTAHQSGSMTASTANGFAQVAYQPTASTCTLTPYAFHPMYATSSPATRVPWSAHSYNVAFSDEIGHFEYCGAADTTTGACTSAGVTEKDGTLDNDDAGCLPASQSLKYQITGCIAADNDFDGPEYAANWPGTGSVGHQREFDAQPIMFTSPVFNGFQRYSQVAFEADMPRIEIAAVGGPGPFCNATTGAGCVNPPPGASFYPFFTTRHGPFGLGCVWQLGGANIPGTRDTFGGSSVTEYGSLLALSYPAVVNGQPQVQNRFEDFRQIVSNPC
ncbi:MAG TPA: hypothetical protein VFB06_27500 [Streptosporangiaceae bacterium]|nr:hypothetical protein [Streptosporangiaceae bacterium]